MKLPTQFDRSNVRVDADGLVTVHGWAVGRIWLKLISEQGTEVYEYGIYRGTTHHLGRAINVGYSRDGAAIACARAWADWKN